MSSTVIRLLAASALASGLWLVGCGDTEADATGSAGNAGGSAGNAGGSTGCSTSQPPPNAECHEDADCPRPSSPDCADVICEKCATWTCQIVPKNVQKACSRGEGLCASPGGTCSQQGECEGAPQRCPNVAPCQMPTCDPATGACGAAPVPDGTGCYVQDSCMYQQTCLAGACQGGQDGCVDSPCAKASCDQGSCRYSPFPSGACDDGNACTEGDHCVFSSGSPAYDPGRCVGAPKELDCGALDSGCVVGVCNPTTGSCSARPALAGTPCDAGLACPDLAQCTGYGTCNEAIAVPSLSPVYHESFDGPLDGWTLEGLWAKDHGSTLGVLHDASVGNQEDAFVDVRVDVYTGTPDRLTSPLIDLGQAAGPLQVSFFAWQPQNSQNFPPGYLLVEASDGKDWQQLAATAPTGPTNVGPGWREQRADVTKYKSKSFRLRWTFQGYASGGVAVALDEVSIGGPLSCADPGG
jgi:hypothetical protein